MMLNPQIPFLLTWRMVVHSWRFWVAVSFLILSDGLPLSSDVSSEV